MFSNDKSKRLRQLESALKFNKHLTNEGRAKLEKMKEALLKDNIVPSKSKKITKKKNKFGIEKGDVFVSCWGYDATNYDFYEVTDVLGETRVKVKELSRKSGENPGYSSNDWTVRPIKHGFNEEDPEYIRSVKKFTNEEGKEGCFIKDKYEYHTAGYTENPFDKDWEEDNYH